MRVTLRQLLIAYETVVLKLTSSVASRAGPAAHVKGTIDMLSFQDSKRKLEGKEMVRL